jgi:competence protein CoiA
MQLYALDPSSSIVAATAADKGKNYFCPECKSVLRIRRGTQRQIHFYHLGQPRHCRQHQKSQEHVQAQLKLWNLIDSSEAQLECPFLAIGRIADVAWHARKTIFEIQCSPITEEEVQQRNRDYNSLGYDVIWILHEKKFNQRTVSAAERYLRSTGCYFTNLDAYGRGMFYDQFEVIKASRRLFKGPPLPLSLTQIYSLSEIEWPHSDLPQACSTRRSQWTFYTQGDLLDRLVHQNSPSQIAKQMRNIENRYAPSPHSRLPLLTLITKSYDSLLNLLLNI